MTEIDGRFVELPSGREVDPIAWLRQPWHGYLAGLLGYEFAWTLQDLHVERPHGVTPCAWVGRFESFADVRREDANDGELTGLTPRVSAEKYQEDVSQCIRDIVRGELFEVNYTTRFDAHWSGTVRGFYEQLIRDSTGGHFALLDAGDFAIASVSPEGFIAVEDGGVETRPIKGTRARSLDAGEDEAAGRLLLASEKDRAENIMIVDLMRNDLTQVCKLGSVSVVGLCELETFAGMHHLVSTVRGDLRSDIAPIDALLSCFPAGSITGAPKLRAIELAATYEQGERGAYTGSMFVCHHDWLQSNVLIRTATLFPESAGYRVVYGAGGAVVSDSDPVAEWEEAVLKVAPLERILQSARSVR